MTPRLLIASILSRDPLRFVIPWLGATTSCVHGVTLPAPVVPFDRRLMHWWPSPPKVIRTFPVVATLDDGSPQR